MAGGNGVATAYRWESINASFPEEQSLLRQMLSGPEFGNLAETIIQAVVEARSFKQHIRQN